MASSLLDIVFPSACIVCGKRPKPICQSCLPKNNIGELGNFEFPVLYAQVFDGATAKVISGYKDQQLTSLEKHLAMSTAELFSKLNFREVTAIFTPARNPKNFRKRGFHPAERLAIKALRICDLRIPVLPLINTRNRLDQRGLTQDKRAQNVSNSMKTRPWPRGQVALFDDVMTTGSTMSEMARACESAEVKVAFGCVLAQRFLDS